MHVQKMLMVVMIVPCSEIRDPSLMVSLPCLLALNTTCNINLSCHCWESAYSKPVVSVINCNHGYKVCTCAVTKL